jgi:hypothetical protein
MPITVSTAAGVRHYTAEEQASAAAATDAWFLKVNGRAMTYEDVIKSFGGRFTGESQVERRRVDGCGEDRGIKNQT